MGLRRKNRRSRRRHRLSPSKRRAIFIPVQFGTDGIGVKFNLRNPRCSSKESPRRRNNQTGDQKMNTFQSDTISSQEKENCGVCEFSFSHWWNVTPKKKSQKLVRPPYMPIAPNNSTQYLIDDRYVGKREKIRNNADETCHRFDMLTRRVQNKEDEFLISSPEIAERLADSETLLNSSGTESESESEMLSSEMNSNIPTYRRLNSDSDYESPEDIDYLSYWRKDFLETYNEMKSETLLKLSKSELIMKIMALENKFESLQQKAGIDIKV